MGGRPGATPATRPWTNIWDLKLQNGHGVIYDDRWSDWIDPLLNHPIFKGSRGTWPRNTRSMTNRKTAPARFDFLLRTTSSEDNRVILGDLKTVPVKRH